MHAIAPIPTASASAPHDIFIGRQPILDLGNQLYAYELLFRQGGQDSAQVSDDLAATATVLSHVFNELGIEEALGPYLGFINLDARMLLSDAIEMVPCDKFVLEVLETVEITGEIVERCQALKEMGYTLAMDDFVGLEERHRPLLDLVDIVKIDIMGMDDATLANTVAALKPWPVKLLAEKVDSDAQAQLCRQLGFTLFQGYYFAKPALVAGKKLSQSQASLLRLVGLILEDADTGELETTFKPEPGLTLNLLRLTNSAASGVRQKITSLRHAITVLGRRQLQRWLQLLLYTNPAAGNGLANPLLQLAATRGRFLELAAAGLTGASRELADHAFMTGIMSLMPALLQAPMEDILKTLPLLPKVRDALEARAGTLGKLLSLAESLEANDAGASRALMGELPGLNCDDVNRALTQALAWAASINREGAD
ncbi:MAG: EAL domain-containing protein [Rhodocyclaceae bacterium]|nr:EAL domain-containing protein [Rhodocyclaceae bacterium]